MGESAADSFKAFLSHDTDEQHAWVLDVLGVDTRDPKYYLPPPKADSATAATANATEVAIPDPIDPAGLPPGPLGEADYEQVAIRNKYLAGLYDPESLSDQAANLVTGTMRDPARVLTPGQKAEHEALTAKIIETLNPPSTPDEVRLDAMQGSPMGAIASLAVREAGGGQPAQDLALGLGAAAEGVMLATAGARTGPSTAFLQGQTGGSLPAKPPGTPANSTPVVNLRGTDYELPKWTMQEITYQKRSPQEASHLRREFDRGVRRDFLKNLGANRTEDLRAAGLNDGQIARLAAGRVPQGYQVHHLFPLDDGGTNAFDNLLLMRNDPEHMLVTNYQNAVTQGLSTGQSRTLDWLMPKVSAPIWPHRPDAGARPQSNQE